MIEDAIIIDPPVSPFSAPREIRAWIDALKRIRRTRTPPDSRSRATVDDAIIQARAAIRWDISDMFAMVGWVQFIRDNNGTLVVRDPTEGTASLRVFQSPNRVGAALAVQARF